MSMLSIFRFLVCCVMIAALIVIVLPVAMLLDLLCLPFHIAFYLLGDSDA